MRKELLAVTFIYENLDTDYSDGDHSGEEDIGYFKDIDNAKTLISEQIQRWIDQKYKIAREYISNDNLRDLRYSIYLVREDWPKYKSVTYEIRNTWINTDL